MNASGISGRLKGVRKNMGLTQAEFASLTGSSKITQARYEGGSRSPDAEYLNALYQKGVDIYYLITGIDGHQLDIAKELNLILDAYEVVEEKLGNKKLKPKKKRELAFALYELYKETDSTSDKLADTVLKLVVSG